LVWPMEWTTNWDPSHAMRGGRSARRASASWPALACGTVRAMGCLSGSAAVWDNPFTGGWARIGVGPSMVATDGGRSWSAHRGRGRPQYCASTCARAACAAATLARGHGTGVARQNASMRILPLASLLALAFMARAHAQQTWIVDANTGGPGALQATVDDVRVQSGDILRVRGGSYSPTTITSKALHVLAEGTVELQQLIVQGIPAQATLSLLGLRMIGIPGTGAATPSFVVRQCAGGVVAVHCVVLGRQEAPSTAAQVRAVTVVDRASLFADWCVFGGTGGRVATAQGEFLPATGLNATNATVTLAYSQLAGGHGIGQLAAGQDGAAAVSAAASMVYVAHCYVRGGVGGTPTFGIQCPLVPGGRGAPAIESAGSELLISGATQIWAGPSPLPLCPGRVPTSAIEGTGVITFHPATFLQPNPGAPGVDPRFTLVHRTLVALVAQQTSVLPGMIARWDHYGAAGTWVFTLLSQLAWTTVPHPFLPGGLHVDPTVALVTGPLLVPGSGALPLGFQVPSSPHLLGARLFVSTVGVDPQSLEVLATPPSSLFVRFQ
jgi:hypothetical protein